MGKKSEDRKAKEKKTVQEKETTPKEEEHNELVDMKEMESPEDKPGKKKVSQSVVEEGAALTKNLEEVQKELLYLRAEFENYKKRMLRDQQQSIRFSNEKMIRELLFVVDLFDRAVSHGHELKGKSEDNEWARFFDGVIMTQTELAKVLSRFGAEAVGEVGEPFDPLRHEAVSQAKSNEYPANTVMHVIKKGCLLHGRLLSPAKVVVAKAPEPSETEEGSG